MRECLPLEAAATNPITALMVFETVGMPWEDLAAARATGQPQG